ncbi:MAG: HRDC domain-containing protein [Planctomycetes bacterium]|nr:HRDC domain-containing protein [Planctomycetota bacterium]
MSEALKAWRKQQADKEGVPALHVVSNKVLPDMAAARPGSRDALSNVPGIGSGKLRKYGTAMLRMVGP